MKSFSLDSSDTAEQAQRRRMGSSGNGSGGGGSGSSTGLQQQMESYSNPSSSSRLQSPSSPVHNRRLLSTRTIRMSSVELPDDNDKSLSSASTSPCPSPVRYSQKPHRLLPNNLYVVLYNFKARREDELDLKAGYKVTVIDTSDPAWWKGKCFGRVGYFPYNYVTKVQPGERPWQVTINLQVLDVDNNPLTLLRDQIRWSGDGQYINGKYIIYFSRMEERHIFGRGFAVHETLEPYIKEFNPVSERIVALRVDTKPLNIVLVCTHIPTETGDEDFKDAFYEELAHTYDNLPGNVIKLVPSVEDLTI
ncbi:hypothetical protein QTP88_003151 [Uroleucon formosanum]